MQLSGVPIGASKTYTVSNTMPIRSVYYEIDLRTQPVPYRDRGGAICSALSLVTHWCTYWPTSDFHRRFHHAHQATPR
jgi:hypothetical protein